MPTSQLSVSCHTKFSSVLHLHRFRHTGGCKMLLWWLHCSSMLLHFSFCCYRLWPVLASSSLNIFNSLISSTFASSHYCIGFGSAVLVDNCRWDVGKHQSVTKWSVGLRYIKWGMPPKLYVWALLVGDVADPACKYIQVIGLFVMSSTADQTVKYSSTDVSHLKVKVSCLNFQYFFGSCSSRVHNGHI